MYKVLASIVKSFQNYCSALDYLIEMAIETVNMLIKYCFNLSRFEVN